MSDGAEAFVPPDLDPQTAQVVEQAAALRVLVRPPERPRVSRADLEELGRAFKGSEDALREALEAGRD
ncbi:MAG TPA: hypothetical protein VGF22_03460 [Acidimicrobiales bacterium]|jgi:hypothetical protein